jgi:DNA-binding NarL/FixJ family response regulator
MKCCCVRACTSSPATDSTSSPPSALPPSSSEVARHVPDLAITDIRMPPYTDEGLVAALRIRHAHPTVGVVVLSQYVQRRLRPSRSARTAAASATC